MAYRKQTKLLVVHVTATPSNMNLTSEKLRAMHKHRGFRDIGYNEWISRDGTLHAGRGVNAIGAHVRGYNSISYGISLEGGRDEFDAAPVQMATLKRRLRDLSKKYPEAKICGHRDLSPDADGDGIIEPHEHIKACPRFDVIPWAKSNRLPAADIKGVWSELGKDGPDARIVWLQRLLRNLGYQVGPTDGHHGIKTSEAIILFQTDEGLQVNGEFDVATVKRLRARNREPETIVKPIKTHLPPDVPVPDAPKVPGLVKPMVKSKTLWNSVVAGFSAIAGFFGGLDWKVQLALLAVVVGALVWIVIERKKHRDNARKRGL